MIRYSSLFLDKFAAEIAKRNVEVLPPIYVVNGGRLGHDGTHQFTCAKEDHYDELLDNLLEVSPGKLQFVELVCPTKSMKQADLLIKNGIILRYIRLTDIRTDEDVERWDALIRA